MADPKPDRRRPSRLGTIIVLAAAAAGLAVWLGGRAVDWHERRALHREFRVEESVAQCREAVRRVLGEPKSFRISVRDYGVMELVGFVVAKGEVEFGADASSLRRGGFECSYDPKCAAIMELVVPGKFFGGEDPLRELNRTLYGKTMDRRECMTLRAKLRQRQ